MKRTTTASVAAFLVAAGLLAGACDNQPDSTVSRQAKEAPGAQGQSAQADLHFKVPDGWQQDPTPRQMREATLLIGEGDKSAEVVVTRLSNQFGDIGDNINRWRGQIGLEPLDDPASMKPRIVKTPVGDAKIYKLEGADRASIIALVEHGEQTWFFRLTGEKATVLANEAKLEQLLSSLAVGQRQQA